MSDFMVKATYVAAGLILYSILLGIYKLLTAYTSSLVAKRNAQLEMLTRMAHDIAIIRSEMADGYGSIGKATEAIDRLAVAVSVAGPDLTKISDNAFLLARGARDIGDAVTALRAVVYGGKRAENFPETLHDDERVRRSNMEYDISQLMIDHGLPRNEAEKRVRDMYATRVPFGDG